MYSIQLLLFLLLLFYTRVSGPTPANGPLSPSCVGGAVAGGGGIFFIIFNCIAVLFFCCTVSLSQIGDAVFKGCQG
jgi:hypothetical protein